MKKRGDRTMTDLYDRTQKIPRLKVLSVLIAHAFVLIFIFLYVTDEIGFQVKSPTILWG